ncbi:MAG TPA: hypothetical protein DCW60_00155, partial [Sutterella sp.]|nr:hypothetical protein [Sutterella sp.]
DPTLRSYLIEQDAKTRAFLKEKAREENVPDSPELPLDARIDVMMGLLEGIGLRKLRNPDIDVDNVCKILAKIIAHETKVFEV